MANTELKERIEDIWKKLKGLKATEIQHHIELSKSVAETIVGVGEIEKIRNSSLLRLLAYQLVAFVDEKMCIK